MPSSLRNAGKAMPFGGQGWWLLPLTVAALVMLPRLRSPQFGLLDDGQTLLMASALSDDWRQAFYVGESGRFFPLYWLFSWGVHVVAGDRPLVFFLANTVLLVGITAGLVKLVRLIGGGRLDACAAGLVFPLSAPIIEGFYTLSKAEPAQVGYIVLSLLFVVAAGRVQSGWTQGLLVMATAVTLLAALLAKETGIIMIPISFGWLGTAWWLRRAPDRLVQLKTRAYYVTAALLAGTVWIMLRHQAGALAIDKGEYTRQYHLELSAMVASATDWMALFARDATWIFPLLAVIPLAVWQAPVRQRALLDVAVWMVGWTIVFLPWPSVYEYFMVPFTFGSAAAGGLALGHVVQAARRHRRRIIRWAASAALVIAALLLPMNLANSATVAAIQLAVDAANERIVRFLGALPAQELVTVSIAPSAEYLYELAVHLNRLERRPDLLVEALDPSTWKENLLDGPVHAVMPFIRNQPIPSVRIGVSEAEARNGLRILNEASQPTYRIRRRVRMLIFNLHQPLCRLIGGGPKEAQYCRPRALWDRRAFSYGWDVYRLDSGETISGGDARRL